MKRIIPGFVAVVIVMSMLLGACSTSKEARKMRTGFKGDWILQTITTEGINGTIKATVFNEADYTCFIGSSWYFNSSNSMGTYTLDGNSKSCTALKRYITWSIYEPKGEAKLFQFKRLDDKQKPMDNGDGFRFSVVQLDDKTIKLKSNITFEGQPAAIVYNFVRK